MRYVRLPGLQCPDVDPLVVASRGLLAVWLQHRDLGRTRTKNSFDLATIADELDSCGSQSASGEHGPTQSAVAEIEATNSALAARKADAVTSPAAEQPTQVAGKNAIAAADSSRNWVDDEFSAACQST